jgi:hypothetical protein
MVVRKNKCNEAGTCKLIGIVCLSAVNVGQEMAAFDVTSLSEDPGKVRLPVFNIHFTQQEYL